MSGPERFRWYSWRVIFLAIVLGAGLTYAWAVSPSTERRLQAPKSGTVLDGRTKKPVPGAYVVVLWHRWVSDPFFFGHGNVGTQGTGCVYREIVRTDETGAFFILPSNDGFSVGFNLKPDKSIRYDWRLRVYAPGYAAEQHEMNFGGGASDVRPIGEHPIVVSGTLFGTQVLEPILLDVEGAPEQRADFLAVQAGRFYCQPLSDDIVPFGREMYLDARKSTCDGGGERGALQLAELRSALSKARLIAPVSSEVAGAIAAIEARYPPPPPYPRLSTTEDGKEVCALLKAQDEVQK